MLAHGCKLSPCSIPLKQKLQLKTKGTVENQLTHIEKLERKTKLLTALTFPSLFICLPSQRNLCLLSPWPKKKKKTASAFINTCCGWDPILFELFFDTPYLDRKPVKARVLSLVVLSSVPPPNQQPSEHASFWGQDLWFSGQKPSLVVLIEIQYKQGIWAFCK